MLGGGCCHRPPGLSPACLPRVRGRPGEGQARGAGGVLVPSLFLAQLLTLCRVGRGAAPATRPLLRVQDMGVTAARGPGGHCPPDPPAGSYLDADPEGRASPGVAGGSARRRASPSHPPELRLPSPAAPGQVRRHLDSSLLCRTHPFFRRQAPGVTRSLPRPAGGCP